MNYNEEMKANLISRLEELRETAADVFNTLEIPNHTQFDDYLLYSEHELDASKKLILMDINRSKSHMVKGSHAQKRLGLSKQTYNNNMRGLVSEGYVLHAKRGYYTLNSIY